MNIPRFPYHQRFLSRESAGLELATHLMEFKGKNPLLLALPRGGVPIAIPIAQKLEAQLDIYLVRKISTELDPEFAIGALAEDGSYVSMHDIYPNGHYGETDADFAAGLSRAQGELDRRRKKYRSKIAQIPREHRHLIIIDDGLATGMTAVAAIQALRKLPVLSIALAIPVAARSSHKLLATYADKVITLCSPEEFYAVGQWYQNFPQVSDEEMLSMLEELNSTR